MQFVEAHGARIPQIGLGTMTLKDNVCVQAVKDALGRHAVLHLCCHGIANTRQPLQGGLWMAGQEMLTVQDVMERLMAVAGLDVRRHEHDPAVIAADQDFPGYEMPRTHLPVVVGRLGGSRSGRRAIVLGHVDVVPVGDPAQWRADPFEPQMEDGRLVGRGACDMKGGVAATLAAFRAVRAVTNEGADLAGEAILVSVPSEEDGGAGTLAAIRDGYVGDVAIIPEPTGLQVVTVHAGAITFRLTVPRKNAHASTRARVFRPRS
jgi:acetylornithine deacetylase